MKAYVVAIGLKIPDNAAHTALAALRRLGVEAARIERNDIWRLTSDERPEAVVARVEADETCFNPNKHRLQLLKSAEPRAGEVWIETLPVPGTREAAPTRAVGWRLFDREGAPVRREVVAEAVERLLCNPAIERARF